MCVVCMTLGTTELWSSKQKPHFFMLLKINMWWLLGDAEVVESLQRKHFVVLFAF